MLLNGGSFRMGGRNIFSGMGPSASPPSPNDPQGYDPNPLNQLNTILTNTSICYRCFDLHAFIGRTHIEDLKKCFPVIVNNIFGFGPSLGWGLRALSRRDSPREMDAVQKLLGPEGPIIQLTYRLMLHDPHLRYEFPLRALPVSVERKISQNDVPAYFPKNIRFKYAALTNPYALRLNPFEYFIYVFASVLIGNRAEQSTLLFGWQNLTESVYSNLLEEFLQYFLPTSGLAVPPIPQEEVQQPRPGLTYANSPLVSSRRNPSRFSLPLSPQGPKIPKLFRPTILDDENYILASRNMALSQEYSPMERENWRSETMVSAFIIMWMHIDSSEGTLTSQFETILPNIEMVKSVRMIVRHFHAFNNVINTTVMSPLEEIKKFLFPLFQRRLYVFLRYLFKHWPMDHSFRVVYETWLSYIQPWRYMSHDAGVLRDREEMQIDARWNDFITENVLFYTYLLQDILVRISKSDLTVYRNAHMVFRVTKIFTSQSLIKPTLKSLDANLVQLNRPPPFTNVASPSVLKKRGNAKINLNTSAFSPRRVSFNDNSFTAANSSCDSYVGQIAPSPNAISSAKFGKLGTTFKDLEDSKLGYIPLFSPTYRDLVRDIVMNMQNTREVCAHYIADPIVRNRPAQRMAWLRTIFFGNEDESGGYMLGPATNTIAEKEKVIHLLDSTKGALASFFDLMLPDEYMGTVEMDMQLPNGIHGSDSESGRSSPDSPSRTDLRTLSYTGFKGHPDYAPLNQDESERAVKLLNFISRVLNALFGGLIREHYLQNTPWGRITRAAVAKPLWYEEMHKRGPGDASRLRKCLAPRIVLRPLGSNTAIYYLLGFVLIGFLFGLQSYGWFLVPFVLFCLYVLVRAYFEPADSLVCLRQEFEGLF